MKALKIHHPAVLNIKSKFEPYGLNQNDKHGWNQQWKY